jgi:hypothetical protein
MYLPQGLKRTAMVAPSWPAIEHTVRYDIRGSTNATRPSAVASAIMKSPADRVDELWVYWWTEARAVISLPTKSPRHPL